MAERGEIGWNVVKLLVAQNRKSKPDHEKFQVSSEIRGTPPAENTHGIIAEEENGSEND